MNSLESISEKVWYDKKPDFSSSLLRTALSPFSGIYSIVATRNRRNIQPQRLSSPVISIGNLTVGGTGKTPFVIEVNKVLAEEGFSGIVLTRGHGRKTAKPLFLDAKSPQLPSSDEAGDEPLVIYRQCEGTPVLIGRDRIQNYQEYVEVSSKPDFVLLDDGLQHHRIHKDVSLCLIDGKRLLGNGSCLPAGPLRESLDIVPSPDAIIITRYEEGNDLNQVAAVFPNVPLIKTRFRIEGNTPFFSKNNENASETTVVLVSGLANNGQFRQSVEKSGMKVSEHHTFPDHHAFTREEISLIQKGAREKGVTTILTTWKDAVKIEELIKSNEESNIKWRACNLTVDYEGDGLELLKKILMKAIHERH